MTLLISIEYRTRWGEQLVLRLGKRRIALQYADGGVWACAVERYAPAGTVFDGEQEFHGIGLWEVLIGTWGVGCLFAESKITKIIE